MSSEGRGLPAEFPWGFEGGLEGRELQERDLQELTLGSQRGLAKEQ